MYVKEGLAEIRVDEGVFFNPMMELCRDVSSLVVGTLKKKISVLDGMCATGARGIRYSMENSCVKEVIFVDLSGKACKNTRHNARHNGFSGWSVRKGDVNAYLVDKAFDFIEIDPFGSPVPYLYSGVRSLSMNGGGTLSVTATDVAVLCGAHYRACLKNYQSKPLDNEYCHENAIRILLGKIARCASEHNLGLVPLVGLSKHHYIKVVVELRKGAERAVSSIKKLGFISHCPRCLWRGASGLVVKEKCKCGGILLHAGPLWIGELHEKAILENMRRENVKRGYGKTDEVDKIITKMICEVGMPATYYDLHKVSEVLGVSAEKVDSVMENLLQNGFKVCKTHFKENSIKTDAGIRDVKNALRKASGQRNRGNA
ncbi:MAG: tRNA (guanine(10)-N(2))-dimethyltransferase [Candidatus Micrarchaeota archaeon]